MSTRFAAFLRGVMPTNAKMPDLKRAFECAGFTNVRTILGSGNLVFDASGKDEARIERKAETAMKKELGREFLTIVRAVDTLRALVETDPFADFDVPAGAKCVVTFLRERPAGVKLPAPLPIELDGARILARRDREVFTAYLPSQRGTPTFMSLIEKTFGKEATTRTWETVRKVAR